jgi:hypothetical protein
MLKLAKQCAEFKQRHHNDMHVLLFCDNLAAHRWGDVLKVSAHASSVALFLVPGTTYSAHPIDAGTCRCAHIFIRHALDRWLSDNENLNKYESGFTASERRVCMTELIAAAVKEFI